MEDMGDGGNVHRLEDGEQMDDSNPRDTLADLIGTVVDAFPVRLAGTADVGRLVVCGGTQDDDVVLCLECVVMSDDEVAQIDREEWRYRFLQERRLSAADEPESGTTPDLRIIRGRAKARRSRKVTASTPHRGLED
jgi:hypothetical protein